MFAKLKLNIAPSAAATLPPFTQKQSFALSNGNDKSNAFRPLSFALDS